MTLYRQPVRLSRFVRRLRSGRSARTGLFLLFILTAASSALAQLAPEGPDTSGKPAGAAAVKARNLPRSYRGISLGMDPAKVKSLLEDDNWFDYRGEADVSLLERPRASLIDAGGSLFIARGLFQFEDEKLISIMLELNPETIDWFTVYTTLEARYGSPADLNPQKAWWEDGRTRVALEKPLTVKYLDLEVFEAALADRTGQAAWREKARKEFLDEF